MRTSHLRKLAAAVLLLALAVPAHAKNVGLLITIGTFKEDGIPRLNGTIADGSALQERLVSKWKFAPADLKIVRNQEATRERILAELDALAARSKPGDTVLIYFSGHGTSAGDDNNVYDLPYDTGAWVPYDLSTDTTESVRKTLLIGRTDLLPRLKKLDDGGRFVLVLTDSCYSGQMVRSLKKARVTRNYTLPKRPGKVKRAMSRPPPPPYPYKNVLMISAASDSETAADISCPPDAPNCDELKIHPTVDNQFHGAFTDAVLRLLDGQFSEGKPISYARAQAALASFLGSRGFSQAPQILPSVKEDARDIAARAFLSDAPDVPPPPPAKAALRVQLAGVSPALRTRIGALSGVTLTDGDSDLVVAGGASLLLATAAGDPVIEGAIGENELLRRIGAEGWLRTSLPERQGELGLRAETDPGSRGGTFLQCETFNFQVKLEKPAYVMILDLDAQGHLNLLYPLQASEVQLSPAGQPQAIPGARPVDRIQVTPPYGLDLVTVIALPQKPDIPDGVFGDSLFEVDGERAKALLGVVAAQGAAELVRVPVRTYPNPDLPAGPCPAGAGK